MKVAVVQTSPEFGNISKNVTEAVALMETAKADLYVLPELFNTGYNYTDKKEVENLSEESTGSTYQAMFAFAKTHSCHLVYGFAEKSGSSLFNSSALVGPGGLIGIYRKLHLYFRENLFFEPGNLGLPVFDLPIGKIGMMICYDWIYPESARTLALKGAQLIAHPSNLVLPYCPDAMVTRCLENRVFAATANRVGKENRGGIELTYIGKSEIVTPRGVILSRLDECEPSVGVQEINLEEANNKQINSFNDLFKDRKPASYSGS